MPDAAGTQDQITETGQNSGYSNPGELLAIAKTESNFNPSAVSNTGVNGIFQITHATWNAVHRVDGQPYSLEVIPQTQTAATLLTDLHHKYDGTDPKLAYLAYNAGAGTADEAQKLMKSGMTYDQAALQALKDKYPNNPAKWKEGAEYPYKVLNNMGQNVTPPDLSQYGVNVPTDSSPGATDNPTIPSYDFQRQPQEEVELENIDVSSSTFSSLFPDIVIVEGLDEKAWFDDSGLITGNPRMRNEVEPVVFEILLKDTRGFILSDKGYNGDPIEIQLNASMKDFNIASKHLFHEQRTRTAFHITLWGMQADVIEGHCTTGVFMNQFGLTDFFSVAEVDDDLKNLVTSGILFNEVRIHDADGERTDVFISQSENGGQSFDSLIQKVAPNNPAAAFRVAAQDAFVEFLSLFKMNGNVWFWNKTYSNNLAERDQVGESAYSPTLGLSNTQANARNNDVMTKGNVVMKFKNQTFLGYFKTLSWTMDANNPFQWNFNFVFQVERTDSLLFYPV